MARAARFAPFAGPRQLIDVDMRGLEKLTKGLETFARKAVPHGVRNGLTNTAVEARGEYVDQARRSMILRNRFTESTIQFRKARGMAISSMESRVGSTIDYMAEQEAGKTEQAQGKHGVPIPTSFAAGQAIKKRPRTKLVQRPNRLPAITLRPGASARDRRQRNAIAIRMALATSNKHVFLNLGRRKGIFKLQGTKRGRITVRLVWDLSKRSVRLPRRPMLGNALEALGPRIPKIQAAAIVEQMRRHNILGY